MNPQERAKSPKVFGILSIIFASITLLFSFFSMLGSLAGSNMRDIIATSSDLGAVNAELGREIADAIGGVYTTGTITSTIFVVFSALLLAIGIGQVGYRRWAASWSVLWGWGALLSLVVITVLFVTAFGSSYDRLLHAAGEYANDPQVRQLMQGEDLGPIAGLGGAIFMLFFFAPYPILLLAFFTKPRVKDSMMA